MTHLATILAISLTLAGCATTEQPFQIQTCEVTGCWPEDLREGARQ